MTDSPHPTDVRVGRLLRERRLALGISQERLGAMLGVTYQQVQKYERGANRIGSSRMHELCKVLNVKASYFFDDPEPTGLAEAASPFDRTVADCGTRETQELLRAFGMSSDAEIRRRLIDLTRALAGRGVDQGVGTT